MRSILIVDYGHAGQDVGFCQKLKKDHPARLVMLADRLDSEWVKAALMRENSLHRAEGATLACALLSDREVEVLRELGKGCANKTIARRLGISEATVKVHVKATLRKLQVANRTQAAIWAMQNGLFDA
ncbi:hypothetical protein ASD39_09170 [Sphingomonas sp. Root50]|nr:hypothetical protein ASD17_09110 [Sphingomonas sp. Root1294]KQY67302.1 hypothetical protein ASD39_09170 [Sphingomonas sp. Root50]KRB90677.1 hypothetical protein ASE22_10180 [Sphingomonas sp. Root720]